MENKQENIISMWLRWHFYQMPVALFSVWKNYLAFSLEFFSVPLLLATLVSPWRHENWQYSKGFDIGQYIGAFVYNIFSRLMGMCLRLCLIFTGLLAQLCVALAGVLIIALFLLLPLIAIALFALIFYV